MSTELVEKILLIKKKQMTLKDEILAIQADTERLRKMNEEWEEELKKDEDKHTVKMAWYYTQRGM